MNRCMSRYEPNGEDNRFQRLLSRWETEADRYMTKGFVGSVQRVRDRALGAKMALEVHDPDFSALFGLLSDDCNTYLAKNDFYDDIPF